MVAKTQMNGHGWRSPHFQREAQCPDRRRWRRLRRESRDRGRPEYFHPLHSQSAQTAMVSTGVSTATMTASRPLLVAYRSDFIENGRHEHPSWSDAQIMDVSQCGARPFLHV